MRYFHLLVVFQFISIFTFILYLLVQTIKVFKNLSLKLSRSKAAHSHRHVGRMQFVNRFQRRSTILKKKGCLLTPTHVTCCHCV